MARAGGGLKAWGGLVLLGLYSYTVVRAAVSNPVRNLSAEAENGSSVTLRRNIPVQWSGDGAKNETQNTTDTSVTVNGLHPGSLHVWVEKGGDRSSRETLNATTAPNPVRNLTTEAQNSSSITLHWDIPEGSDSDNLTYWVQWTGDDDRNETQNTTETSFTAHGLNPGSRYEFSVWVEKDGVRSSVEKLTIPTAPNPVRNLTTEAQNSSSITLRWDVPEGSDSNNLTYWVQWTGDDDRNETQNTTETSFTAHGLNPGSRYEFSVWVEKDGVSSSVEKLTTPTAPNPVRNLRTEAQNSSSITLRWDVPEGSDPHPLTYWVQWTGDGDRNETQITTETSFTAHGLNPGSRYEFSVWVEKDGVRSSVAKHTNYTAPNPVRNLRAEAQNSSSITLRWDVPEGSDSNHLTYWVQWTRDGDRNETQNTTETSFTAHGLNPGSRYEFSVWVEKDGVSSSVEKLTTPTAPNPVRNLRAEAQNSSSITLRWDVPEGSDSHLLTYWVQWTADGDRNETQNTNETSFTAHGLNPGSRYEFSVWVEKDGVSSSVETLTNPTAPNPVRNLRTEAQNSSSITLRWDVPEGSDSDNLTYWVQWTGDDDRNETQNTTETSFTAHGLNPGSRYEFSVWVEKDGVRSSAEKLTTPTDLNPVKNLTLQTQTNSSITLRWEVPEGSASQSLTYCVQWSGEGAENKTQNTTNTYVTIVGLSPASAYEFSVWAQKDGILSPYVTLKASTAPNPVGNLRAEAQNSSSITLRWDIPEGSDSHNLTYWVQWTGDGDRNGTLNTTDTSVTVNGLNPGSPYEFSMWVEKDGVRSSVEMLTSHTAPNGVTHLQKESQTNNSVTLRWNAPADSNSQLYTYWVQWASGEHTQQEQDPSGHWDSFMKSTNETWYKVETLNSGTLYNFSVWAERNHVASSKQSVQASTAPDAVTITSCISTSGGYGVVLTWSCPFGGYESFELEVGGPRGSHDRSSCERGVYVSGLSPAQSYTASIKTVSNGLETQSASVTCYTESGGVIAGAIVGILLAFILVGLLVFFLRKRSKKKRQNEASKDPMYGLPGDILAKDFADYVRKNEKDSSYGFAEEYQQLALVGQGQSQTVASAPENMSKNRYRNVLPYDWSRVPLQPLHEEPGSDYINASFMPGLWSPNEFIAAQGPLPHTVGDFWRLVWEQRSHTLVMLTNCMESGRVKCEHYWPLDAQPCVHGQLQVTLLGEEVTENWTVRDLQLLHMKEQKTLSVRQFHYLAWPDHGVPYSPDPLLAFWKTLRQQLDQAVGAGPPIVHCSAGVGRTGTLIALDVLLRQLECEGLVGPFDFIRKMRESRPLMVQTEAQYVFLHQCILRFLQESAQKEAVYENSLVYENEAYNLEV